MSSLSTAAARRLTLVPAGPRSDRDVAVRRYRLARVVIEGPEARRGRLERPRASAVRPA